MAEIPKQNKINKKYKIAMIFALFLLTIPTPYQKIFSFFPQYFEKECHKSISKIFIFSKDTQKNIRFSFF